MPGRSVNVLMSVGGGAELKKELRKVKALFLAEMEKAMAEEASRLMAAAADATPTASGTLLMSLTASSSAQPTKGRVRFAVAYLDEKAAAVHEGIHWAKKRGETLGFKWYERTLNKFETGFVERITGKLKTLVGGR